MITNQQYKKAKSIVKLYEDKLEKEKEKTELEVRKKLVGTYWIYRKNSYSCPSSPEDYWSVFREVLSYNDDDNSVWVVDYQTDSHKWDEIKQKIEYVHGNGFTGWEQINFDEFAFGKQKVLDNLGLRVKSTW